MDDLFDVSLQQIQLIAIGPNTLCRAQREIAFCEHCHPHDSELPFDWLLAEVTGKRGHTSSFWANWRDVQIVSTRLLRRLWSSQRSNQNLDSTCRIWEGSITLLEKRFALGARLAKILND